MNKKIIAGILGIVIVAGGLLFRGFFGGEWDEIEIAGVVYTLTEYKSRRDTFSVLMDTHLAELKKPHGTIEWSGNPALLNRVELAEYYEFVNTERKRCGTSRAFLEDWGVVGSVKYTTKANEFLKLDC